MIIKKYFINVMEGDYALFIVVTGPGVSQSCAHVS